MAVDVTPKTAYIWAVGDSVRFTAGVNYGGSADTSGAPTSWVSRDPSLVSVSSYGVAKSLKKGGSTYVVATAGGKSDSGLVSVPTTACASIAAVSLQVGQVATDIGANGFCATSAPDAEYTLITFNSSLSSASTASIEVTGLGLAAPPATAVASLASRAAFLRPTNLRSTRSPMRDVRGEAAFRAAEVGMLAPKVAGAQQWYRNRSRTALRVAAPPAVGDIVPMNVSMSTSSSCPSLMHDTRVVAVSNSAIVLSDVGNPTGGFTDAEYASIAVRFDTLINPLDVQTFGAPTDLDNNGRVIILFTREINAQTPANSASYIGGRTMQRDLFPKTATGDKGGCPGSNVAEVFYMAVADPTGAINGNKLFTHDFILSQTPVTIAHEYQHMINFSRRMYLLGFSSDKWSEEIWLHEGLSHEAEELLFHRTSGLATRANLGIADIVRSQKTVDAFNDDMIGDFFLYDAYLRKTATSSPYRQIDDLTTRGATWSFLRYAMDQRGSTDGTFLYDLVNSGLMGLTNLQTQLGLSAAGLQGMFRDFAISVYADGHVGGLAVKYTQPSWDMRSIYPGFNDPDVTFPLVIRSLSDGVALSTSLTAGGFSVYRFKAVPGVNALVRATGSGGSTMPSAITLSVIRTK